MFKVVNIKSGMLKKISLYDCGEMKLDIGDVCIFGVDRGKDSGIVVSTPEIMEDFKKQKTIKKIIRKASPEDIKKIEQNKQDAKEVRKICQDKILKRKLEMKLVAVEYIFDKSKLVCYFTSDNRVDFRDLVKDLASEFKVRIELRQIGVRDESKILCGYGRCGQILCCCNFCRDFEPVTIRIAKEQRLPLNPTKISGTCGRLMCCLAYEYENYKQLSKKIPREGSKVVIEEGKGVVCDLNIIKQTVLVRLDESKNLVEVPISNIKKAFKSKNKENKEKSDINLDSDEGKEEKDSNS